MAGEDEIVLLCGRYEGVDERVKAFIDEEISVGDYTLSGGEPAANIVIDAVDPTDTRRTGQRKLGRR